MRNPLLVAGAIPFYSSADGSGGSNFGNLTEVAGAAALVRVETLAAGNGTVLPAQNITAGSSITNYAIFRDTFSNFITNGAGDAWALPFKSGGVADGDLVPAVDRKSAVFTGHVTGTATIRVTSGALAQGDSGTLTIVAGPATRLFVTLPNETFTAGSGNSGTVLAQTVGVPFTITKLTAVDNFTNEAPTYSGSKTVSYSGPGGNPTYTTNVSFTAGLSTTSLATTLNQPETTSITATASGLTGVPSSTLIVRSMSTPPTIGPIVDQVVYVDHPALIQLQVSDAETAVTNLQLSLVTSNPTLVPATNVLFRFFAFDGHWYITLAPAFGVTGVATNTVTVSDGTNGVSTNFVFTVNPPPPGAARFANLASFTIPDVGPATLYPSTINVAGMNGPVTNLTLSVNKFGHEYPDDVHMLLVGPAGQGVVVLSKVGGGNAVTNVNFTLTDAAPFPLSDTFEIWSEQFTPTDFGTTNNNFPPPAPAGPYGPVALSTFNGQPANGTWSLYVWDDFAPDHGEILGGWSLMIAAGGEYIPPLKILSVTGGGTTNVVITWSAISNVTYRVQYQADLNPTNWSNLSPDITATNTTASMNDNSGAAARRFYRVRTVP